MAKTPSQVSRDFGRFVHALRKACQQTQKQLAERADLSADTVLRLEHGTFSPSLHTLSKLVAGLRVEFSSCLRIQPARGRVGP
ncbi:helix-turn-helix domain-containing protein [Enhygromyxa salina]|uniref:helix-turn-helix domain-containing protein n=1 Tax=Enhygromyxa salina TaxID=215803 RepID=UPI000D08AA60